MKKIIVLLSSLLFFASTVLLAQKQQTYMVNGTKYYYNQTYKTTGYTKVDRSSANRKDFLKSLGYTKVPAGYQVDHIVPLSQGGADQPYNMQLITTEQHKVKTASEKSSSTSYPVYSTPSTTNKSTNYTPSYYTTPSYNSGSGKTIYSGSRGGQYYINSNGNKSYIKH